MLFNREIITPVFAAFLLLFAAGCHSKKVAESNTAEKATANRSDTPQCIATLIQTFEKEPVQNPPRKIYRYDLRGKTVYYVTSVCCDQFSDLYDEDCNLLGHPDGGFSGRGDGSLPDFLDSAKNRKLIWQDQRVYK